MIQELSRARTIFLAPKPKRKGCRRKMRAQPRYEMSDPGFAKVRALMFVRAELGFEKPDFLRSKVCAAGICVATLAFDVEHVLRCVSLGIVLLERLQGRSQGGGSAT